jgi:nucleotide-binding universal stress UspA family protein
MAQAKRDSKRLLAGFRKRLSLPVSTLEFAPTGTPAAAIVGTAKEWSADLIVIASHGRAGVARALLGSVAEGVMRNAPCPVLVIRAQI